MMISLRWLDRFSILVSLMAVSVSVWSMSASGVFDFALYNDEKLVWHLIRSSGIVAYLLLTASVVWGLFLSSQLVKDWSPGPVSMTLHSTISTLALLTSLIHALLLLLDDYLTFSLSSIFVPFTGPYRPEAVGVGTIGFWILLLVTISFPLRKWLGHKSWRRLHYASYAAFGLVTAHGLFAGTDAGHIGFQALTGAGIGLALLLTAVRLGKSRKR